MSFFDLVLAGVVASGVLSCVVLAFITAPYGRHDREGWGPTIPTRIAWVLMESPSTFAFAWFFLRGPLAARPAAIVLFLLWQAHYFDRAVLYPLRMRVAKGARTTLLVALLGFAFNLANSYLNGTWLGSSGRYEAAWLATPQFAIGTLLFTSGYWLNRRSDAILRALRRPGETGYAIPYGAGYRWVSCPNYLGELCEWIGFAVACWSLAAAAFAFFTATNLVPRALANHRWYREKFPGYPKERRAIVPYVL